MQSSFDDMSSAQMSETLSLGKTRARIYVICLELDDDKRRLMLAAMDLDMLTNEYVYIFPEPSTRGFGWLRCKVFCRISSCNSFEMNFSCQFSDWCGGGRAADLGGH